MMNARLSMAVALLLIAATRSQAGFAADRIAYLSPADGYWQVWVASGDGRDAKVVSRSAYDKVKISWFSGGDRLLIGGAAGELRELALADGAEHAVTLPLEHGGDAVVSPDGKWIAFSAMNASGPDTNDVWLAQIDGSLARKIVSMPALQHEPAWSPSSQQLFFLSGPGGQSHDIYRVDIQGQNLEQLTVGSLYHFDVAVAADGSLAFSSNRRAGNYDIWLRDRAGRERATVATPDMDSQPQWSANGRELYFTRTQGATPNIWKADRNGKGLRAVTHHSAGARGVAVLSTTGRAR